MMTEKQEWLDRFAKENEFAATPIGMAFFKFKNALSRAWQLDTEDSFTDKNRKATKEAWENLKEVEREFRVMLEKIMEE